MFNCPRCRERKLEEVPDSERSPVKVCGTCGGIWVPGGALGQIGRTELLYSSLAGSADEASATQGAGLCPEGHGLMARATAALDPPVPLDRCPHCCGIWFDHGEWQVLAQSHLAGHIEDLWSRAYRRSRRRQRIVDQYLQRSRDRFDADLFADMLNIADRLKGHGRRSEALAFMREMSAEGE